MALFLSGICLRRPSVTQQWNWNWDRNWNFNRETEIGIALVSAFYGKASAALPAPTKKLVAWQVTWKGVHTVRSHKLWSVMRMEGIIWVFFAWKSKPNISTAIRVPKNPDFFWTGKLLQNCGCLSIFFRVSVVWWPMRRGLIVESMLREARQSLSKWHCCTA